MYRRQTSPRCNSRVPRKRARIAYFAETLAHDAQCNLTDVAGNCTRINVEMCSQTFCKCKVVYALPCRATANAACGVKELYREKLGQCEC